MRSPRAKRYTVDNNVRGTHNLLCALVDAELDAAVVHLGTMGVYGYGWSGSAPIPEGYLAVKVPTPDGELVREILHPANPGSVYHMTKTLDQLLFAFYAKNDGVRITDLHQGIVWGTQTSQTGLDDRLVNRFDYDGDYGTVLNRFLMQAAIGHPLTVHGTGGQTRAFIHIRDTVRCIEIAINNPPDSRRAGVGVQPDDRGPPVKDLAALISKLTGAEVVMLPNPRKEAAENDLVVQNDRFLAAWAQPDDSFRRPARGGPPDRQQVPRPGRHLEDRGSVCLAQGHGSRAGPAGERACRAGRRRRAGYRRPVAKNGRAGCQARRAGPSSALVASLPASHRLGGYCPRRCLHVAGIGAVNVVDRETQIDVQLDGRGIGRVDVQHRLGDALCGRGSRGQRE